MVKNKNEKSNRAWKGRVMKKTIKKIVSIMLVIALCMPLFGEAVGNTVYATSETEETYTTLSDGSEWIFDTGSANTLSVLDDGSYQITTTETSATAATAFSMMQNRAYPASTVHNLSVDYRVSGTSFGFTTTGSLEGTDSNGKGVVKFYREESGNTTNLYLKLESVLTKVASFTATRATLAHITIVKADNGSYYLSFKGNVVNGSNYGEDVQEAVKLENYFTKEYLEQDGLLYFFAMADGFNPSNPVRYFVSSTYGYPYTVSSLLSGSDRNTPSTWKIGGKHTISYGDVADHTYEFVAGAGGITKDLVIPVTSLGESAATPFITNFAYSSNSMGFSGQDWHYIYFSNDPTFETYDYVSVVRVENSGKPHVIFNSKTVTDFVNMLYDSANYGASYYWTFQVVEGAVQLKIQLGTSGASGTFSGFTSVSANKPIYMKIAAPDVSKYASSNVNLKYRVNIAETEARTAIATMESDIIAAKQEVDGGKNIWNYADAIDAYKNFSMKKGLSYEALLAGSELIWQYDDACSKGVEAFAQKVEDLVASISVEELEYQDIDIVYALRDEYDSMTDDMKAQLVGEAATLNAYVTKADTLEFEGSYRTTSGDRYRVMVDDIKDFTISSAPNGGISVTTANGGYNDSKYGVAVMTEKYYPIVGTKFDVQCNFGTTQNSSVIELKSGEKTFSVIRQHSSTNSTINITVNGEAYTCLTVSGQLRTRVYEIGVVKSNGSWYLTYDGYIINGSDCSEDVQNALKLENTFGTEFMEQNKGVQFCIWTDSLGQYPYLYMCPTTKVENGVLYQMAYSYGDKNLGTHPCSAAGAVNVNTNDIVTKTPSHAEEKTSVSFTFNRKGDSAIVSMPLDATKGWTTSSNMALYSSSHNQHITYQLSNDPTFSDGTELSFKIILFGAGNSNVYYNDSEQGDRFGNFFSGSEVAWSITTDKKLEIGGIEYPNLDMSSYVEKPIYMKIVTDKEATFKPHSTTVTIPDTDGTAYAWLTGNGADLPDDVENMTNTELSAKLKAYFASGYRFSSSNLYKETTKAMELEAPISGLSQEALAFTDNLNCFIECVSVEELLYQDKETVNQLKVEYDALSDDMKCLLLEEASILGEYVTYANALVYNGIYRTSSGDRYRVKVKDANNFTVSSAPNGGISVTTANGGYNDSKYGVAVETEKYYPIVGTKFDVQCNFGTTQNSSVIELKSGEKTFSVIRQHSSTNSTINITVNGEAYTCLTVSGQLRTRVYEIGVVKSNGSWYLTYDGYIINGSDCSEDVQNALKLENTFGTEFMEQNKGVQFCIWTDSLGQYPYLYMCPTTKVENGVLYQMAYTYGDRNLSTQPCSAATAVSVNANDIATDTPSHVEEKTSVSFTFNRKADSAIVSMPLDATKGWTTISNMEKYSSNHDQWITYQLSNDPTFSDGTELSFKIILFGAGNTNVYYNNAEQGSRFTNFFNGSEVAWSITSNNCLKIGSKEYTALDMSSYVSKPIYMKIITDVEATFKPHSTTVTIPDADGVAYNWLTGNGADLPDKVGNMTSTELSAVLSAYFTSGYRFSSTTVYHETTKAMELALAGASDVTAAQVVDAAISTVYPETIDWYYHGDAIQVMYTKYNGLTSAVQNSYVTNQQNLMAMKTYLSNLTAIEKDTTTKAIRKGLVGTEIITTQEYDFYHDDALDVRDLVRIKKSENAQATDYMNESAIAMTLQASDYGAVGDGEHNDAVAVDMAVSLLSCYGPGSILNFENEKAYYIGNVSEGSVFVLNNVKGLTIDGNGSTFIIGEKGQYGSIEGSKDCEIREAIFDYETSPAFAATYSSGHQSMAYFTKDYSAQFTVTTDIGLEVGETYEAPSGFFGVIKHETGRCHMYIDKYEMVSENKVKVYFDSTNSRTKSWYSNKDYQQGLILPTPNVGHAQERAFTIRGNDCFDMEDVIIRAAAKFGMFIANNEGKINFTNVDFAPENQDFYFTSWRDAYHCRDNRASIHWMDCDSQWNYDDVFNVSASKLHISEYDADGLSMSMIWTENPTSNYYDMLVGDQIQVLDTATGKECGIVTVTEVVSQADGVIKVKIDKALSNDPTVGTTLNAYVLQRCGAGSTITNGTYNGTFRFRAPMTIANTKFDTCMRMWIGLEAAYEGPLPQNILFQNCTFDFGTSGVVEVNASSDGTTKDYHVDNVVFDGCTGITSGNITGTDKDYITIK